MNPSSHLPPESLFGYEHQLLTPDEVRGVHEHIAQCEECRSKLAERLGAATMESDLRAALGAAGPRTNRTARMWLAYAAAAAILATIGLTVWFERRDRSVEDALRTGSIPQPEFVKELNPPREVLMGRDTPASAALLSPKGTAVLSQQPSFLWKQLGEGWNYKVQVFALDGVPAAESPDLATTAWICDRVLARDRTYEWQITALRGNEHVTLEKPPEAPARFRIVDASTAARLQGLAAGKSTYLQLAVEYGRAGLLDDARREMRQAIEQHPGQPALERLLDSLQPAR